MTDLPAPVSRQAIAEGLESLGLRGQSVAVHSSLRSFGAVAGGAAALIQALQDVCANLLMPGFQCAAKVLPPPSRRYRQNGCDYRVHFDLSNPPTPFAVDTTPLYPKLGAACRNFSQRSDVGRSDHPWHSWLGWGGEAQEWLRDHPWESTHRPLEKLDDAGGFVLLLGVGLSSCTAVHLAEEEAGRRPFIRWAMNNRGQIREVATSGCAKGFDALEPMCSHLFRLGQIGTCRARAARLGELRACLSPVIRAAPELTRCASDCLRCRDAILGGPLPPEPNLG